MTNSKIAIIGAGNMGGAIARGLAARGMRVAVSNPSLPKLEALSSEWPSIEVTTDNAEAARGASIVILAVKPWLVGGVAAGLKDVIEAGATVASLAATVTVADLESMLPGVAVARVMPNTAISLGCSTTFIAAGSRLSAESLSALSDLFAQLGSAYVIEERQMDAAMAVASCGIAYALRYMRAATQGAVELGLRPAEALSYVASTLEGAAALVRSGSNPEVEIDKVTTPGGLTIRGLNAMEAAGFSHAVVEGLLRSVTNPKA